MPLTLSHPAAVLPLRRLGLPMTVLVIGSMAPDLPLFLGSPRGYEVTHSVVGIVTVDLVITGVLVAGWFLLARDALVDLSPGPIRSRLPPHARPDRRAWVLAPLAACIGAATHVAWDSFTHPGRWGAEQIDWLQSEHAGLAGMKWAQYVSGVVGLAVVIATALAYVRAAPPIAGPRGPRVLPAPTLPVVVAAGALTAVVSALRSAPSGVHAMAFNGVVDSLIVLAAGLGAVSATWQIACRTRLPRPS